MIPPPPSPENNWKSGVEMMIRVPFMCLILYFPPFIKKIFPPPPPGGESGYSEKYTPLQ